MYVWRMYAFMLLWGMFGSLTCTEVSHWRSYDGSFMWVSRKLRFKDQFSSSIGPCMSLKSCEIMWWKLHASLALVNCKSQALIRVAARLHPVGPPLTCTTHQLYSGSPILAGRTVPRTARRRESCPANQTMPSALPNMHHFQFWYHLESSSHSYAICIHAS